MENEKQKILQAIKENNLYYYIANNYWKLEKDTIIDLLKEVVFLLDEKNNETLESNLIEVCNWKGENENE